MEKQHWVNNKKMNGNNDNPSNNWQKKNNNCKQNQSHKNECIYVQRNVEPSINTFKTGSYNKYNKNLFKPDNTENDFEFLDFDKMDLANKNKNNSRSKQVFKSNRGNRSQQRNPKNQKYRKGCGSNNDIEFVNYKDVKECKQVEEKTSSNFEVLGAGLLVAGAILGGSAIVAKALSENKTRRS